jgi:DNA-binding MarR family transcriptional regulator
LLLRQAAANISAYDGEITARNIGRNIVEGEQGYWLSVSELARLRGVDKAAISRRAKRYEEQGLLKPKAGRGGVKLICVAEFDRAAGMATDAVRELNGAGGGAAPAPVAATAGDPVLPREQARRAAYDADLKKLDLDERLGKLLPVEDVEHAMVECAEAMVRIIDQVPGRAEEVAAAVASDGTAGARTFLRDFARDLRTRLAQEMRLRGSAEADGDDA